MPTISVNDHAPDDLHSVSLANAVLDLSTGSVDSTDQTVLANAAAHPWLTVTADESESYRAEREAQHVKREDDALVAENSVAFDVDKVRETEEAKRTGDAQPVAIEAGLDQDEPVEAGGFAVTHAADDTDDEDGEV